MNEYEPILLKEHDEKELHFRLSFYDFEDQKLFKVINK